MQAQFSDEGLFASLFDQEATGVAVTTLEGRFLRVNRALCRMTGYLGRIGLYEIMVMTPNIRKLINASYDDAKIREQGFKDGMKPLRVSGAMKVAAGITTADEVVKVAPLA